MPQAKSKKENLLDYLSDAGGIQADIQAGLNAKKLGFQDEAFDVFYRSMKNAITGKLNPVAFKQIDKALKDKARKQAHTFITRLTEAEIQKAQTVIAESLKEGLGVPEIARRLTMVKGLDVNRERQFLKFVNSVEKMSIPAAKKNKLITKRHEQLLRDRRRTIAQTEARFGTSVARETEAKKIGAKYKVWLTVGDNRVSEICRRNQAQGPIPIEQEFRSGHSRPPSHPNCRCTLSYTTKIDDAKKIHEEQEAVPVWDSWTGTPIESQPPKPAVQIPETKLDALANALKESIKPKPDAPKPDAPKPDAPKPDAPKSRVISDKELKPVVVNVPPQDPFPKWVNQKWYETPIKDDSLKREIRRKIKRALVERRKKAKIDPKRMRHLKPRTDVRVADRDEWFPLVEQMKDDIFQQHYNMDPFDYVTNTPAVLDSLEKKEMVDHFKKHFTGEISNGLSEDVSGKLKHYVVRKISSRYELDYDVVNRIVKNWAFSSNSIHSTFTQSEAARMFGQIFGTHQGDFQISRYLDKVMMLDDVDTEVIAKVLKGMYEITQEEFKRKGIKTVRLYRGFRGDEYAEITRLASEENPTTNITLSPLNSFTLSARTALSFSGFDPKEGMIIAVDVPVERILSTFRTGFGCWSETEFVVIGDELEEVTVVRWKNVRN